MPGWRTSPPFSFRSLARHAGDEFVAVTPSVEPDQIVERLNRLEEMLRLERATGPTIRYAVGRAQLAVGGDPEETLRAADVAMYSAKGRRVQ